MNFQLNSQGLRSCALRSAVLLYAEPPRLGEHSGMTVATIHDVSLDANDRPTIMAGRPMNQEDLRKIVDDLEESQRHNGVRWMDPSVLAMGPDRMIWWTPAQSVPMFFQTRTFSGRGVCPVPAMVWMYVEGDGLYLFALQKSERPDQTTQLFQAPLMNVWSRGKVCVGNAVLPAKEVRWIPSAWHQFMWGSNFTHPNFSEKNRLIKGGEPGTFWKRQLAKPDAVFPNHKLVKVNATVEDLLGPEVGRHLMTRLGKAKGEF